MLCVVAFFIGILIIICTDFLLDADDGRKAITAGLSYAAIALGICAAIAAPTGQAPEGAALSMLYASFAVIAYCGLHWYLCILRDLRRRSRSK